MKQNSKTLILENLSTTEWKSIEELGLYGYSNNNLATRLPELAKIGKVESRYRVSKHYKEWRKVLTSQELLDNAVKAIDKCFVQVTRSRCYSDGTYLNKVEIKPCPENQSYYYAMEVF
jgi:hypothetical protein